MMPKISPQCALLCAGCSGEYLEIRLAVPDSQQGRPRQIVNCSPGRTACILSRFVIMVLTVAPSSTPKKTQAGPDLFFPTLIERVP